MLKHKYSAPSALPNDLKRPDWYKASYEEIAKAFASVGIRGLNDLFAERPILPEAYAYAEAFFRKSNIDPNDYRYHAHDQQAAVTTFTRAFNPTGVGSDWSSTDGSAGTNMRGSNAGVFAEDEVKYVTGFGIAVEPATDADIRLAMREGISRLKLGDTIVWADKWNFLPTGTGINQDSENGMPLLSNRPRFYDETTGVTWAIRLGSNDVWTYEYLRATALSGATWVTHYMFGPFLTVS